MKTRLFYLAAFLIFSLSCRSVEKMLDRGDYDAALSLTLRKISGTKGIKQEHVLLVEEGFRKVTIRDMQELERLQNSEKASDLLQSIRLLDKIQHRQDKLSPYLPLTSADGYQARFTFVRTLDLRNSAIERFQEYTYRDAHQMLERSRHTGNKALAREAYYQFDKLWEFASDYLDARDLQEEAQNRGISHISVSIENHTEMRVADDLLDDALYSLFRNEKWVKYHFDEFQNSFDREITVLLDELDISPERIRDEIFTETAEFQDGFEYVLDERGNVLKDSLGNDIKKPRWVTVNAQVIKTFQNQSAALFGKIRSENYQTGQVDYIPLDIRIDFEHCSAIFRGDPRALSLTSKNLIQIRPLPFPSRYELMEDLVAGLIPAVKAKMRRLDLQG